MPPDAKPSQAARRYPAFSVTWLTLSSVLFLFATDASWTLPPALERAVSFVPADVWTAPWRLVPAIVGMPFARDPVQFAYVMALTVLGLVALEWWDGWRRAAFAFLAGGIAGVVSVTFGVLLPLALAFPDAAVVEFTVTRSYMGASTSAMAALGALAMRFPSVRARAAFLAALALWEVFLWGWYYGFAQLIPLYHYGALAAGALVTRTRAYAALAR